MEPLGSTPENTRKLDENPGKRSFGSPLAAPSAATRAPRRSESSPERPRESPRCSGRPQGCSKSSPGAPKIAPRALREPPRATREPPRVIQEPPRVIQELQSCATSDPEQQLHSKKASLLELLASFLASGRESKREIERSAQTLRTSKETRSRSKPQGARGRQS